MQVNGVWATVTPSLTPVPTDTPTLTSTFTQVPTLTLTPTFTLTPTETFTPTSTPTAFAQVVPGDPSSVLLVSIGGMTYNFQTQATYVDSPTLCAVPETDPTRYELIWRGIDPEIHNWYDIYHATLVYDASQQTFTSRNARPVITTVAEEHILQDENPVWSENCTRFQFSSSSQWGSHPGSQMYRYLYSLTEGKILGQPESPPDCLSGYIVYMHPELVEGRSLSFWMCDQKIFIEMRGQDVTYYPIGLDEQVRIGEHTSAVFPGDPSPDDSSTNEIRIVVIPDVIQP